MLSGGIPAAVYRLRKKTPSFARIYSQTLLVMYINYDYIIIFSIVPTHRVLLQSTIQISCVSFDQLWTLIYIIIKKYYLTPCCFFTVVTALIIFVKYKRTHQKRGKAPAYPDIYTLPDIVKANSDVLDANSSSNFDSLEEGDVGGFNSTSSIFQ